jgi:hypothetical protein
VGRALIDGEAVVLMDDGRSDLHALMTKRGGLVAALIAFDLLRSAGIRDVDSGDNSTASVDAKRAAIQSQARFLNFPAQETRQEARNPRLLIAAGGFDFA